MKKHPFSPIKVPVDAITDERLSARDFRVLALLIVRAGKRNFTVSSQVGMANDLGCSRATVQRSLNRLAACRYIKRRNRTKIGTKVSFHPFAAHSYTLCWLSDGGTG